MEYIALTAAMISIAFLLLIYAEMKRMQRTADREREDLDSASARAYDTAADLEEAEDKINIMRSEVDELKKQLSDANAVLGRIDTEELNRAMKAQADFDTGFANILNYTYEKSNADRQR